MILAFSRVSFSNSAKLLGFKSSTESASFVSSYIVYNVLIPETICNSFWPLNRYFEFEFKRLLTKRALTV
jgi:hypothetical protein